MKPTKLLLIAFMSIAPSLAHADFNTICRGGNIPYLDKEIKQDVKAKLTEAGIAFKSVSVSFINVSRTTGIYTASFKDGLTLTSGSNPVVNYTGTFTSPESCTLKAKLKIRVSYGGGAQTSSVVDVEVPGEMLFKSRRNQN